MSSIKMMQTGSSDVCRWRLRELVRGDVQGRLGEFVPRLIWVVLACPVRMLRIGKTEMENQVGSAKPGLPGKWPLKRCTCSYYFYAFSFSVLLYHFCLVPRGSTHSFNASSFRFCLFTLPASKH